MPVETAVYLDTLDVSQPPSADPMAQGANHLRLLKTVLKATFPNLTGPLTSTQADLNAAAATTTRVTALEGNRVRSDADTASTGSLTITGTGKFLDAPLIKQAGNALIPAGCIIMWSGALNAIPAGWLLCDGTSGTPDLRSRFIIGAGPSLGVGVTGGSTTYSGATDTQGSHSHGGATAGAGSHYHSSTTTTDGSHSHGGTDGGHALTITEMPSHDHGLGGQGVIVGQVGGTGGGGGSFVTPISFVTQGGGQAHNHTISADGAHFHTLDTTTVAAHQHAISADGAHAHAVAVTGTPPYAALAFIIKT